MDTTTVEDILHDHPVFSGMGQEELLSSIGCVAHYLRFWRIFEYLQDLGEKQSGVVAALEQLSEEQLQQVLLPYLASQLQQMPIPCGCCGQIDSPREPESGFCERCDRLLNSPAALQVCGTWDDGCDLGIC